MGIHIQHGRLIDPANRIDKKTDLFIEHGKVAAIGKAPAGFVAEQVIDASGQYVIPGIIDLQAHLREPGEEYKATIASETRAAVAGGVTTLCLPPDTRVFPGHGLDTTIEREIVGNPFLRQILA